MGDVKLNEQFGNTWKENLRKLKTLVKYKTTKMRFKHYLEKLLQSEIFSGQDVRCHK